MGAKTEERFVVNIWAMADGEAWRIESLQGLLRWMDANGSIHIEHMNNSEAEVVAYDDEIGFFHALTSVEF
jgi:hypothetical protein